MLLWQKSIKLIVAPKQEQNWEYTGMIIISQEATLSGDSKVDSA